MTDWEVVEYHLVEQQAKAIAEVIDPKKIIQMLKR